jgi:hypothetical protein
MREAGSQRALAEPEKIRLRNRLAEVQAEESKLRAELDAAERKRTTGELTREELEALARRLVERGPEGCKIDFKRSLDVTTGNGKAEFAKDVSSLANTDDEQHHDDWGIIVLGAERGQIVGGVADFAEDKIDGHQAHLSNVLSVLLAPVPRFLCVGFLDQAKGPWGLILIPPSVGQPHIFSRDTPDTKKHEWLVRVNDTTERAGALDYVRVQSKAVSRAVRPLEREIQRLNLQVEGLEQASGNSAWLSKIPRGAKLQIFLAARGGGGAGATGVFDHVDETHNAVYLFLDATAHQHITARSYAINQVRFVHTDGLVWHLTIDS